MSTRLPHKSTKPGSVPHRSAYDAFANRICRKIIEEAELAGELLTVGELAARFELRAQAMRCAA